MTIVEEKPKRHFPCWLVGHRPTVTAKLSHNGEDMYRQRCKVCAKAQTFLVNQRGRYKNSAWQVLTEA